MHRQTLNIADIYDTCVENAEPRRCEPVVGANLTQLLPHLRYVKGEVQCFSRQSLGRTVPHPADLEVGQVTLRVAVHRMDEAGRA